MLHNLIPHFCSLLVHVYKQLSIDCGIHFWHTYANALLLKRERSNKPGDFWSVGFHSCDSARKRCRGFACHTSCLWLWQGHNGPLMTPVWLQCAGQMIIAGNLNRGGEKFESSCWRVKKTPIFCLQLSAQRSVWVAPDAGVNFVISEKSCFNYYCGERMLCDWPFVQSVHLAVL